MHGGRRAFHRVEYHKGGCCQVYGVIGIFGAARYGLRTEGNVLVNRWLGGRAEGLLDLAIAAYLSISIPPMQVASPFCPTMPLC